MKIDDLIIKMIDEMKDSIEKSNKIIHGRIDKLQEELKSVSKFRWQAGGVIVVAGLLITVVGNLAPTFLTPTQAPVTIERQ